MVSALAIKRFNLLGFLKNTTVYQTKKNLVEKVGRLIILNLHFVRNSISTFNGFGPSFLRPETWNSVNCLQKCLEEKGRNIGFFPNIFFKNFLFSETSSMFKWVLFVFFSRSDCSIIYNEGAGQMPESENLTISQYSDPARRELKGKSTILLSVG